VSRDTSPGSFRPEIQGLRAVAVTLVVLCHAGVPFLAGGYIGVDVFFVVSGFLITRWLLGRAEAGDGVPFAAFYATRARRILPAAALALVVICLASCRYLNDIRALSAVHDALWASVFLANVHFAEVGADYFARSDPPSPIQHFWTLAVEEQFYLVWPFVVLALDRRALQVLCVAMIVGALCLRIAMVQGVFAGYLYENAAHVLLPARMDALALGGFVALAAREVIGGQADLPTPAVLIVRGNQVVAGASHPRGRAGEGRSSQGAGREAAHPGD